MNVCQGKLACGPYCWSILALRKQAPEQLGIMWPTYSSPAPGRTTAGAHFDEVERLADRLESPLMLAETAGSRGQMHQWCGADGDTGRALQL